MYDKVGFSGPVLPTTWQNINFSMRPSFPENGAKMALKWRQIRNSKIRSIKQLPNLIEKRISKLQLKILKNVGGVAILVIETEQKAQTEIQLIL